MKSACFTSLCTSQQSKLHCGCQQLTPVPGLMSIAFYCLCVACTRLLSVFIWLFFDNFARHLLTCFTKWPSNSALSADVAVFHFTRRCVSAVFVVLFNAAALLKPYYNSHRALRLVQVTFGTWVSSFPDYVNLKMSSVSWLAGNSQSSSLISQKFLFLWLEKKPREK